MFDDPFAVDRKLREAARAWLAWRRELRRGGGEEHRFETLGAFASAELVRELRSRGAADPLAPALSRWAYRLYLEHGTRDLVALRERAFRGEPHALATPVTGKFTLRELLDAALADTKGARRGFLDALGAHAGEAGSFELRRWERRIELSHAVGIETPDALELPAPDIVARARAFLEATNDAMSELGVRDARGLLEVALGTQSVASWPSRLTVRSLAELFDETPWLAGVALDLEELPRALGASSFLRGLAALGASLRAALAPTSAPFVVASDPFDLAGATLGALFTLLPMGASFARRKLGVARTRLDDHRRLLARVLLVGARTSALRVVSRDPTLEGSATLGRAYPELVFRALGVELRPSAAGVLVRSRVSDPARFTGLLLAAEHRARLETTHDEDWYRNPRAVEEVREGARELHAGAVPEALLDAGSRELARHFAYMP